MNTTESYCRLCAELKPAGKLIDLQSNSRKRNEIVEKLIRLNAATDLSEDMLPITVCFVCTNSLDKAFEFILGVEQAQGVLNDILFVQKIKKEARESPFSDDDNFPFDPPDVNDVVKKETDETKPLQKLKITKKPGKKKVKNSSTQPCYTLDGVPLSQLKLTWKDYEWMCCYCGTQFATIDELTTHSMQYHECCNAYRCTDCNIRKLRLDSFLVHVKRHRKYLKFSCYKCNQKFKKLPDGTKHKKVHKNTDHICPGCNATFPTSEELEQHTKTYYQLRKTRNSELLETMSDNLTCILCKKSYKNKGSLNTHLLLHTDRKRDHTCDKCGKCFFSKQNLAGHMILHETIRPFQCEICKFSFKTEIQLRNHVGVHDTRKPFSCDQCGRCFRLQKQLISHKIIHTDLLPYVCTFCNKAFRFKTILNQHVRQHTGIKPYNCQLCQRDFTNWPNYNKHMKRRHGLDMAKKKHTPDGLYPVNPATGEVIVHQETDETQEWKAKLLQHKRPGRPKQGEVTEHNALEIEEVKPFEMGVVQN